MTRAGTDPSSRSQGPWIEACGLTREYGEVAAVRDVSLRVCAGQVHALVGLNGAGKSTLLRLLLGMVRPTSGVARVLGEDVARMPADRWAGVGQMIDGPFGYPTSR